MMTFLENLLQRHQPGAPSLEATTPASYIVQPRPQARFESDQQTVVQQADGARNDELLRAVTAETESGSAPAQRFVQTLSPLTTGKINPLLSPTIAPAATPGGDMESGHEQSERASGRTDAAAHSFDQTPFEYRGQEQQRVQPKSENNPSPAAAIKARTGARQSFPLPTDLHRALSQEPATHQDSTHHAEDGNVLNRRIETILQAILDSSDHQSVQTDEQQSPVDPGGHRVLPRMVNQEAFGAEGQTPMPEPVSETPAIPRQSEQAGSLQIPHWLTDIQTELQSRLREINRHPESEPVVNVTIGRVEVRAVQDKPAKQTKARSRPSGVMTLDAYLKQRDRRGQA